jgi:hypothetical protein
MPAAVPTMSPQHSIGPFRGPVTTIATMVQQVRGERGERSVLVRSVTERVVRGLQPKDYLSEILAIRNWVAEHCRFLNDPLTTEWVKDPQRIVEEILHYGVANCDCDEISELMATMARQIGREAEFVTVGFGRQGSYSHVFCRVKEPKSNTWIVCDPVAGTDEAKMLRKVTTSRIWRID